MRTRTSTTAIEDAQTAGGAVRALNHSTLSTGRGSDDFWPSDVYSIIGELAFLAHRLPQALSQLTAIIASLQGSGSVSHDEGLAVDAKYVASIADHLTAAGEGTTSAAEALDKAHVLLAHLRYDDAEAVS